MGDRALPRGLHPVAWWLWALCLMVAAARTTNIVVLVGLLVVLTVVVRRRKSDAPWGGAYRIFLRIAAIVLVVRAGAQIILGIAPPGNVLVTLPTWPTPAWAAGMHLGGPITDAAVLAATADGLRLGVILACVGAANALADPKRLIKHLPAALYEIGVSVVVATSFTPQLLAAVGRIRAARRLRGHPDRGIAGLKTMAMPVLADALDRAIALAAAMDSRGYGRRDVLSVAQRRRTACLVLAGMAGLVIGLYGLLGLPDQGGLAAAIVTIGAACTIVGLQGAGAHQVRSRYRPDTWQSAELFTVASGLVVVCGSVGLAIISPSALHPTYTSAAVWSVPWLAALTLLVGVVPAYVTPPPKPLVTARRMLAEAAS